MTSERLRALLQAIRDRSAAVFGDFCLDAYWLMDPARSEVSIETGKRTRPVREQRYSLGGAGNIVANLLDLGVAGVYAVGVLGDDLFGRELMRQLATPRADGRPGADIRGILIQKEEWATPVYGKPYVGDDEQERMDFGVGNTIRPEKEERLLRALRDTLGWAQAVIVNQQLPRGVNSEAVIAGINGLAAEHPDRFFIVDARDRSERYLGMICRLNEHEAARLCGRPRPLAWTVSLDECRAFAEEIGGVTGKPVFISRGERGALVFAEGRTHEIPAVRVTGPTDPVGAGDTSISAIAAALAAGAAAVEAAELANLAAGVTVRKLRTTGTATPAEILAVAGAGGQQ